MRLEAGQAQSASERALACIAGLESLLAAEGLHDEGFATAVKQFQEFRMILDGSHAFSELSARLQIFECPLLTLKLSSEAVQVTARFLSICKRVVLAGGALNASLDGVLLGLIRVCQAMAAKEAKETQAIDESSQAALSKEIRAEEQRYRAEFLEDSGKNFHLLEQYTAEFAHTRDANLLKEIFRLYHTVKGNASMLGLESMAAFAHKVEGALVEILERESPITDDELANLNDSAKRLLQARKLLLAMESKLDANGSFAEGEPSGTQALTKQKKFLPVKSGTQEFVFDCLEIFSVVTLSEKDRLASAYESPRGQLPVRELAQNSSPAFGVWVRLAGGSGPGLLVVVDEIGRIFESELQPENMVTIQNLL